MLSLALTVDTAIKTLPVLTLTYNFQKNVRRLHHAKFNLARWYGKFLAVAL